jgi:hypothetical protein
MLLKYAEDSAHLSFYCLPADEKDILALGGEYMEDIGFCPRCSHQMRTIDGIRL